MANDRMATLESPIGQLVVYGTIPRVIRYRPVCSEVSGRAVVLRRFCTAPLCWAAFRQRRLAYVSDSVRKRLPATSGGCS